jgi:recombination protein RecT
MSNNKEKAIAKRTIVDAVEDKVQKLAQKGELHLPKNYSAPNALKAAWLILQETTDKTGRPVLEVCDNNSIANALFRMIIMGLNPIKKQCDFIAYGKKLVCQPEYFGNIALVKRKAGAKEVYPHVIYESDEFEYEIEKGITRITKHKQAFQSRVNAKYIGGYCVIEWNDDRPDHAEIMTMNEIEAAWKQGQNYKNVGDYENGTGTHGKFTEEMIKKSVTNRACKRFINSSDDSDLIEAYNEASMARTEHDVQEEIEENANSEVIDIETEEPEPQSEPELKTKPEYHEESAPEQKPEQQKLEGPGF